MLKPYITPKGYKEKQTTILPPFRVVSEALISDKNIADLPIITNDKIICYNAFNIICLDQKELTQKWRVEFPANFSEHGLSYPLVYKKELITDDAPQKCVYLYNIETGQLVNKLEDFQADLYSFGSYFFGFLFENNLDYIAKFDYEHNFKEVWKMPTSTDWMTRVLLDSNRVIFNTRDGFHCHDWETGRFLWEFNKKGKHLLWNGQVIIPDGRLTTSLDIHTGQVQWEQVTTNLVEGTIYEGKLFLANATQYKVLDVKTGQIEIEMSFKHIYENFDESIIHSNAYGLAVTEDYAIFGLSSGYLFIIDKWTGELVWHLQRPILFNTTPLVEGNRIYVAGAGHESANILVIEGSK